MKEPRTFKSIFNYIHFVQIYVVSDSKANAEMISGWVCETKICGFPFLLLIFPSSSSKQNMNHHELTEYMKLYKYSSIEINIIIIIIIKKDENH